jgi:hypothetical protein
MSSNMKIKDSMHAEGTGKKTGAECGEDGGDGGLRSTDLQVATYSLGI